jgi:hypothetical protein
MLDKGFTLAEVQAMPEVELASYIGLLHALHAPKNSESTARRVNSQRITSLRQAKPKA